MKLNGTETVMEKVMELILISIIGVMLTCIFAFITALAVCPIWNLIMPAIFGVAKITYMQAVGLSILTSLMFRVNLNLKK